MRKPTQAYSPAQWPSRVREIVTSVAWKHGLKTAELLSKRRFPKLALARFELFATVRDLKRFDGQPAFSYAAIGLMFGVDHTTVLNGVRRHAELTADAVKEAA